MTVEPGSHEMPEFLTDEWVVWLNSALSECRVDASVHVVLEHRVSGDDSSVFCWHVRVAAGLVSAAAGPAGEASGDALVTLGSDRETARAIAVEGGSAQRAFAEGRLRLDGDPLLLLAVRPVMEAIGEVLTRRA